MELVPRAFTPSLTYSAVLFLSFEFVKEDVKDRALVRRDMAAIVLG
jgi:hypothetical protein